MSGLLSGNKTMIEIEPDPEAEIVANLEMEKAFEVEL